MLYTTKEKTHVPGHKKVKGGVNKSTEKKGGEREGNIDISQVSYSGYITGTVEGFTPQSTH